MTDRVKWGILGCGNIVRRRFMPGVARTRRAEVVAIASRELAKAEAFAAELGIPKPYGGYNAILNDPDIEAVYIPLPNWLHAEWAVRASERGKHVLCEKPLAVDAKEAQQVVDACRANGTLLMEGFMYRFHPRTIKARQLVDMGRIGEARVIKAWSSHVLHDRNNIRFGPHGGSLSDAGCYCVNAARYFFGSEPAAVYARQHSDKASGVDISFAGTMEFSDNRIALFDCSFEYAYRQGYEIIGTAGTLRAERGFVPGDAARSLRLTTTTGDPETVRVRAADQFALEVDQFSDCVRTGRSPLLHPQEAVNNLQVMDALRVSARTGERVEIPR